MTAATGAVVGDLFVVAVIDALFAFRMGVALDL